MALLTPDPVTPDSPVLFPSTHVAVVHTPCLPWRSAPLRAGAGPEVSLSTWQLLYIFSPRCSCSPVHPADLAAASNMNMLVLRLTARAWSRIIGAFEASGLFTQTFISIATLREVILAIPMQRPDDLRVVASDWAAGDKFVRPAADSPANKAIRRRLSPLRLFAGIPLPRLELESPSPAPWMVISTLAGYLGPCLTNASRVASASAVQFAANKIWSHFKGGIFGIHLSRRFSCSSAPGHFADRLINRGRTTLRSCGLSCLQNL